MNHEALPLCLCGEQIEGGGGGSFGPSGSHQTYGCKHCGRYYADLSKPGGHILLTTTEPPPHMSQPYHKYGEEVPPEEERKAKERDAFINEHMYTYVNEVFAVTCRDQDAQNEDRHDKSYDPFRKVANEMAGMKPGSKTGDIWRDLEKTPKELFKGIEVPESVPTGHRWNYPVAEELSHLSEEERAPWQETWDMACDAAGVPHGTFYEYLPLGKRDTYLAIIRSNEFEKPQVQAYPPQLPPELTGWVYEVTEETKDKMKQHQKHELVLIDRERSNALTVPRDPIVVNNEVFFTAVFGMVAKELGLSAFPDPIEVKNEYGGKEPWYTFMFENAAFKVGWRKRVVNIEVIYPTEIVTEPIRKVALDQDNVTYTVSDRWHDPSDKGKSLCVHAWGRDKCIEYLTILMKMARKEAA